MAAHYVLIVYEIHCYVSRMQPGIALLEEFSLSIHNLTRCCPSHRCRGNCDSSPNHITTSSPRSTPVHSCTSKHVNVDVDVVGWDRYAASSPIKQLLEDGSEWFVQTLFSNEVCVQQCSLLWQLGDASAEPGCSDLVLWLLCEAFHLGPVLS